MPKKRGSIYKGFSIHAAVLVGVVGVAGGIAYGAYVALPYVLGPTVAIHAPRPTEHGTVLISGDTKRVSKVAINELEVPITEHGGFEVERAYPPGYTVVIVEARDRFGRSRTETLTFITSEIHASQEENDNEESTSEDGA